MDEERLQGVVKDSSCVYIYIYIYIYRHIDEFVFLGSLALNNAAVQKGLARKCHVPSDSQDR